MKKRIRTRVLLLAMLSDIALAGCGTVAPTNKPSVGIGTGSTAAMAGMKGMGNTQEVSTTDYKLSWTVTKRVPNVPTTITIQVKDLSNRPVVNFDLNHEKKMHVIIVSKDLSYFNHIHPEYVGNGRFAVTTVFPHAGMFELYADFKPTGKDETHGQFETQIAGNAPTPIPLVPDSSRTKTIDGKKVTFSTDMLMAGMDLNVKFHIVDARTGKPVTDLEPYLGAVGHGVVISKDGKLYLHVHPIDENSKGPDAIFMTHFDKSGIYKVWGQFQEKGHVFTVPFVVQVP